MSLVSAPPPQPPPAGRTSTKAGGAINATGFALQFLATLLLTPFIIRHVGKEGYGVWVLVSALGGNYGLINLGLSSALVRHVALYTARGEEGRARQVSATALIFLSITGCVVCVSTWAMAAQMAGLLGVSHDHVDSFIWLIRLTGLAAAVDFTGVVFSTGLIAHERFLAAGLRKIFLTMARPVLTVALIWGGFGLTGLGVTALAISAASLLMNMGLVRRLLGPGAVSVRGASFAALWELLRYGFSTLLIQLVDIARMRLGPLVLAGVSGVGAVASFGLASSLVTQFNSMVGTVVGVLSPRIARLDGEGARIELRKIFAKSLFFCGSVSFAFLLMIYFFGQRFLLLWVGPGFADAVPTLQLLALAYGVAAAQTSGWSVMLGLGKHHFMAVTSLVEIVIIGVGAWFFAPQYGAVGMAVAVTAAMLLTKGIVQPLYLCRIVGLSLREYLQPFAGPFLAAGLLGGLGLLLGLPGFLATTSFMGWMFLAVLVISLYALLVLGFCFRAPFFVNPIPARLHKLSKGGTALFRKA